MIFYQEGRKAGRDANVARKSRDARLLCFLHSCFPYRYTLLLFLILQCATVPTGTTGAAGPVCSANLESASCRAAEVRAADYAFRKAGQRFVYVVRDRSGGVGAAWTESRKRFAVTAAGPGQVALVAENRLMAASKPSGVFVSAKGIDVDDQVAWPRYTIFPAVMSTLAGAVLNAETTVPAGKFAETVTVVFRRGEKPEGGERLRIHDRIVFAKGVGIVRREVETLRHGEVRETVWELAAIEETPKEE